MISTASPPAAKKSAASFTGCPFTSGTLKSDLEVVKSPSTGPTGCPLWVLSPPEFLRRLDGEQVEQASSVEPPPKSSPGEYGEVVEIALVSRAPDVEFHVGPLGPVIEATPAFDTDTESPPVPEVFEVHRVWFPRPE